MPGLSLEDADSSIRIVVTPTQSSYFAGEPFSVKVTFTNTRSPEAVLSKPGSHSHKRGSHSISSAPLARPPTSPGPPRASALASAIKQKHTGEASKRKHFIGQPQPPITQNDHEKLPELMEQRRRRQLATKSLSVSVSPYEFQDSFGGIGSTPLSQQFFHPDPRTINAPRNSSPLARTDMLNLSSKHPHARKRSILDGQFSLDYLSPTTSVPPLPYTPNSSTASFTLALDPITEGAQSPYPDTPAESPTIESVVLPLRNPATPSDVVYGYPLKQQRSAPLGLGQPPKSPRVPPRTATELILYSYIQLTGSLILNPELGEATYDQIQTLNSIRCALLNRTVLGGGSMDITSSLTSPNPASPRPPRHRHTHTRSSSLSAGLLSIFSSTSLAPSIPSPNPNPALSKWRSTSGNLPVPSSQLVPNGSSSPNMFGLGFGNNVTSDIDSEAPLPTLEMQPAMLAVDLSLAPGESRSYVYSVKLPENLPPTFKGRSFKFSYELVLGTCRAIPPSGPNGGGLVVGSNSISRVMKVPIRVYNNVTVTKLIQPYNLLWPVRKLREGGISLVEEDVEKDCGLSIPQLPSSLSSPTISTSNTFESIKDYARSLLQSLPAQEPESDLHSLSPHNLGSPISSQSGCSDQEESTNMDIMNDHSNLHDMAKRDRRRARALRPDDLRWTEPEKEKVAEGGLTGCREAVEILTRNPKKVSYDVNKDGIKVAVLTFTKSAYRLGETITGVVEINEKSSRARVLKVSSILECHESLPPTISSSHGKILRRSHAESHCSFTLNTLRTTFSLDIPSDASPAFQIYVDSMSNGIKPSPPLTSTSTTAVGGLVWKVRLCLLVGIASEHSIVGPQGRFRTLNRDGPRGEWGSSWIATSGFAPLEKLDGKEENDDKQQALNPKSWSYRFMSSFLGSSETGPVEVDQHGDDDSAVLERLRTSMSPVEYDGIIPDPAGGVGMGVNYLWDEEGWRAIKLETVECEVPVKVFPSNTAFKAVDVVFDV